MGQPSGCIPERPGTGLVRWSARLVLFLLAAGLLLLLGEGHARAASSERRSVADSVGPTRGAPVRVARELVSSVGGVARRRPARPAGAQGRTVAPRPLSKPTASVSTRAARSLDTVAGRAGRRAGQVARGRAGRGVRQALEGATRRVDVALGPVERTLERIVGPVTEPVGDVLDGPLGPVDLLPGLTHQPPRLVSGTGPALARADGVVGSAHGGSPAVTGTVRGAWAAGPAGPLVTAGRAAVDHATAGREPGAGRTAYPSGTPAIPAAAPTIRDAPTGSLAAAVLTLFLLLLWSVPFGTDGRCQRARPPLLFPA